MRASLWAIASFAPPASRFFAQAQSERSANPAALSFQKEGERFSLSSEETAGVRTSILQTNFSIFPFNPCGSAALDSGAAFFRPAEATADRKAPRPPLAACPEGSARWPASPSALHRSVSAAKGVTKIR